MKYIKRFVSFLFWLRIRLILLNKVNHLQRGISLSVIDHNVIVQNKKLWKLLGNGYQSKWLKMYISVSKKNDYRYISEIDYYCVVEPTLNHATFAEAYSDKNFYHKIISPSLLPYIIFRNIQGVWMDQDYKKIPQESPLEFIEEQDCKLIVKKAIESGGGKGVSLIQKLNGLWLDENQRIVDLNYLNTVFCKNYVVQEYILQHEFFAQFNPTSVNTIRILTYRSVSSNKVFVIQSVFRIGKIGSFVDNQASGGISCGVDLDTARLNGFAVNKNGQRYTAINDIAFMDVGPIPNFFEMKKLAIEVAEQFPYHRLLGFDFCVTNQGITKIIEINNKSNEINFFQMNNGPLFGGFTEEIIDFCLANKKTITIDFEL